MPLFGERKLQYQRNRRQENSDRMRELKESTPCADCGRTYPAVCMDFDHVSGTKKLKVSGLLNHSWDVILAEIAKCEIVCSNCHRIRTHTRNSQPVVSAAFL